MELFVRPVVGHVAGMLDRDQRTAKSFTFDRQRDFDGQKQYRSAVLTSRNEAISHQHTVVLGKTSPTRVSSCSKTRKNGYFWKSLHRLKHALIVGAYLSLVVTFPGVLSAPTIPKSLSMSSSRERSDPPWLTPCPKETANGTAPEHRTSDSQLSSQIANQAYIAETHGNTFKEDFVRKTFNMDVQQLHKYYKDTDYEWLPTKYIPKQINHKVPQEHLDSLEFTSTLLTVYAHLQKIAVGIEQIVWDEKDRKGEFEQKFSLVEGHLRTLLCEIYTAIVEKDLTGKVNNVTRDVMGREFRDMDKTSMFVRNWIIYRDYLNMVEYVIQVFNHFRDKLSD